ncbi:hypothetical protein L9F63_004539, partial [Diploptera punctata]
MHQSQKEFLKYFGLCVQHMVFEILRTLCTLEAFVFPERSPEVFRTLRISDSLLSERTSEMHISHSEITVDEPISERTLQMHVLVSELTPEVFRTLCNLVAPVLEISLEMQRYLELFRTFCTLDVQISERTPEVFRTLYASVLERTPELHTYSQKIPLKYFDATETLRSTEMNSCKELFKYSDTLVF